jgi:hypothetical protein
VYKNATVNIYILTATKNTEGTPIKTWGYLTTPKGVAAETFRADVQSHRLSEAERELWGLSTETADVKRMFFKTASYVTYGNRAAVTSDWDSVERYYEIKPVNLWPNHGEVLLVPVQGE